MKRLGLLISATAAVVALLVSVRVGDKTTRQPPAAHSTASPPHGTALASSNPPTYRSGTAVGRAHTDFGDVRLRVVVIGGRIAQVKVLELPHGNRIDLRLSRPAARTLTREVIHAQSAQVDTVSGATYTSDGYLTSLQAALDRL